MLCWMLAVFCVNKCIAFSSKTDDALTQDAIMAEPGYRAVKLKWRYDDENEDGQTVFLIKYCELVWDAKYRCRKRYVSSKQAESPNKGLYETTIYDLRMSTNYSFTVEPRGFDEKPNEFSRKTRQRAKLYNPQTVTVTTNGFAAEIIRCIDDWSEIAVRTGRNFGGKIAVENSHDDRCAVYGNRSSRQEFYILRIDHKLCGSRRINNTEIQTTVMVHENKDVVTHNSRRYLVQCNLLPQIFSLKASIHIPNGNALPEAKHVRYPLMDEEWSENDLTPTSNNVQDSRMDAEQSQAVHKTLADEGTGFADDQFAFMTMIGGATVVVSLGTILCVLFGRRRAAKKLAAVNTSVKRENSLLQSRYFSYPKAINQGTCISLKSMQPITEC